MIPINELRIGNYIYNLIGPPFYVRVDEIQIDRGRWVFKQHGGIRYDSPFRSDPCLELMWHRALPIKLTHEILTEWCGFTCIDIGQYSCEGLDGVIFDKYTSIGKSPQIYYNDCVLFRLPDNLHQLQNLYYSLTGQELQLEI